jgi:hypothetical protein
VAGLRSVPVDQLKRAATANTGLVEVAKTLTQMAQDTELTAELRQQIRQQIIKILDSADAMNRIIEKSAPLRD